LPPFAQCGIVLAGERRRETRDQALHELRVVFRRFIGELDRANAFVVAAINMRLEENGRPYNGSPLLPRPAVLVGSCRAACGAFVEAAAGAISGGVEGGGHVVSAWRFV